MSEIPHNHQGLYVDLDAVLDTRLGCINKIHSDLVIPALRAGYFTRAEDSFPNITKEAFKEVYAARHELDGILENSPYTKILPFLQSAVKGLFQQSLDTPLTSSISLDVNVWPYVVDDEEKIELLRAMRKYMTQVISIEVISVSPEDLTANICREKYSMMIKYDYSKWSDCMCHPETGTIKKNLLTAVTLYAPKLYEVRKPTAHELTRFKIDKIDLWHLTEKAYAGLISLQLLNIDMFCAHLGDKYEEVFRNQQTAA